MSNILKTIEGVATAVIALYVAFLGTMQWRISRDKVRLDLYNRRFNIYNRTMDFTQALMMWQEVPDTDRMTKRIAFIRVVRESRFLLSNDPSILALLEEINVRSFKVTGFIEVLAQYAAIFPEQYIASYEEKQENLEWIMASLSTLETKLDPYLAFGHRRVKRTRIN